MTTPDESKQAGKVVTADWEVAGVRYITTKDETFANVDDMESRLANSRRIAGENADLFDVANTAVEEVRAVAAELRATEKYKTYKVDRPLNEVDGATGYLWLGLQYERGVYEERMKQADRLEAIVKRFDAAIKDAIK